MWSAEAETLFTALKCLSQKRAGFDHVTRLKAAQLTLVMNVIKGNSFLNAFSTLQCTSSEYCAALMHREMTHYCLRSHADATHTPQLLNTVHVKTLR